MSNVISMSSFKEKREFKRIQQENPLLSHYKIYQLINKAYLDIGNYSRKVLMMEIVSLSREIDEVVDTSLYSEEYLEHLDHKKEHLLQCYYLNHAS